MEAIEKAVIQPSETTTDATSKKSGLAQENITGTGINTPQNEKADSKSGRDLDELWSRHHAQWRDSAQVTSHWEQAGQTDPELLSYETSGEFFETLANLDITILVTPKGNIHNKPILNYSGLPINNDQDYQYELENVIEKTTRTFSLNNQNQKENIIDAIKISCRKITKEITGKKPVTHIKLVRI